MSFFRTTALILLSLILTSCTDSGQTGKKRVSVVALIATPEKYDGEIVQITGFARIGPEEAAIYLSKDDAKYSNTANSIWIEISESSDDRYTYDAKWIFVEGTFRNSAGGHLNQSPTFIENITRIELVRAFSADDE